MEEYEDIMVGQVWSKINPLVRYEIKSLHDGLVVVQNLTTEDTHVTDDKTIWTMLSLESEALTIQPTMPQVSPKCSHNWKKDMFFSAMVYYTCSKCGTKQENT
jgi:hypothetical protein